MLFDSKGIYACAARHACSPCRLALFVDWRFDALLSLSLSLDPSIDPSNPSIQVPPTVGLVGHHAGDESLGLGFGVLLALHSAGAATGAIAAGAVYDAEPPIGGRYGSSVLACAALCGT